MPNPEQSATASAEHKPRTSSKWRRIGAMAASAAALAAGSGEEAQAHSFNSQTQATASPANIHREPDMESYVRSIEDMPGYGIKISKETRKQLADSTVKIVMRAKGSESTWAEFCTGLKVKIDNQVFITSAKHCFNTEGWQTLSTNYIDGDQNIQVPAVNIAPNSAFEYAVVDPRIKRTSYTADVPPVVAVIEGIMLDPNDNTDWALLKPVNDESRVGNYQIFKDIPSVDLMKMDKKPVVGQEIAVYGLPQVTNSRPVAGKGLYLGTFKNPYLQNGEMVLVGLQAKDQIHDSCLYGASGSSAMANGILFSGLALRNNVYYYGSNSERHLTDGTPEANQYWRDLMERSTGVNLDRFTTICGYTIKSPRHWLKLKAGMENIAVFPTISPPTEPPVEKGGVVEGEPLKGGDETADSDNK